jgi:hypothetical protein
MKQDRLQHLQQLTRPRASRGSALLEAVVVSTTLVGLLALGTSIHRQHVRELTAARDARSLAWGRGLDGCEQTADFRGLSEQALQGTLPFAGEQLVTHTQAAWMSNQGTPVLELAPCNEVPRGLEALSSLDAALDRQLLLLPRRGY